MKTQLLKHLFTAAALLVFAAACSDDNDNDNNGGREPVEGGIPVAFTADINPGSADAAASDASAAGPATRTVLTPDAATGGFTVTWRGRNTDPQYYDDIRIWAFNGEDAWANDGNSKWYVATTSAASSPLEPGEDGEQLTLPSAGEWTFAAAYGYRDWDYPRGTALAEVLPLVQTAPGNTSNIAIRDFSVATARQSVDASGAGMPTVSLEFQHKLSALQLNVTNSTGDALTVSEIRLSRANGQQIDYQRYYDIAAGTWKDDAKKKDYLTLTTFTGFPALASEASQTFHMLLFPGYANEDMTLTVVTDRGEYAITKPAPGDGGFAEGINYNVSLSVRTSGLDASETWTEYISTAAQLADFRDRVNSGTTYQGQTVRLTADITLTDTWTPIGTSWSKSFKGTFDGGWYHIKGLNVNTTVAGAGLFGEVNGGTVRNLRVSGSVTTTKSYAGGIAGMLEGKGTVENCIFDGNVSGSSVAGGIAGYITDIGTRVAGCYTKGTVKATNGMAGGIAGWNDTPIGDCYSEADVTTSKNNQAGGITGNCSGAITHCYATGRISGSNYVGGIAGNNASNTFTGCIALNPAITRTSGSFTNFGRIVGDNNGTVTSCAAFAGMEITDGTTTITPGASSIPGDDLTAAACLSADTYTSRGFTAPATDGAPGWAFDTDATPWTYLPWNPAFARFPGIQPADYRIAVPVHLLPSGGIENPGRVEDPGFFG